VCYVKRIEKLYWVKFMAKLILSGKKLAVNVG